MSAITPTGRKFIVADPATCIGCKTCMAACLMQHNKPGDVALPRLTLATTRTISAPIGCYQCADAPCVDACPTGCLFSDANQVGVHPEKCIGCRNCVLACPYGAVDIVTEKLPPEPEPTPESLAAAEAEAKTARVKPRPKKRKRTRSTVVKCDLCTGCASGPACITVCPTDALHLIDEEFIERSQQSKRKEAARATVGFASMKLNLSLDKEN